MSLTKYKVVQKIFSDSHSITYDVTASDGSRCRMTEFFPEKMAAHDLYGGVHIEDSMIHIFEQALAAFIEKALLWQRLDLKTLPRIIEVVTEKQTGYVFWEEIFGLSYREYLTAKAKSRENQALFAESPPKGIHFQKAFEALAPILADLDTAQHAGLYFPITMDSLFLSEGGILRLNTFMNASLTLDAMMIGFMDVYCTMITGSSCAQPIRPPSAAGAALPRDLDILVYKVLTSAFSFLSLAEMGDQMQLAMAAPGIQTPPVPKPARRPLSTGAKWGIGCGGCGCLVFLILAAISVVGFMRFSGRNSMFSDNTAAEPSGFPYHFSEEPLPPEIPAPSAPADRMPDSWIYNYVYSNPEKEDEIYDGMVLETADGDVYYRRSGALVKESADGSAFVLEGVFPAFLQEADDTVYYCDGYDNYCIYRMKADKSREKITENMAGFLQIYEQYLYFTNGGDWDCLYRMDLIGGTLEKLNAESSYELVLQKNYLYYVNADDDDRIYSMDLSMEKPEGRPVNDVASYNLKALGNHLIYLNQENNMLEVINAAGDFIPFPYAVTVYCFDVSGGNKIYYLDSEGFMLHLITLGGEKTDILNHGCSYVKAAGGSVYFIDDEENYRLFRVNEDNLSDFARVDS